MSTGLTVAICVAELHRERAEMHEQGLADHELLGQDRGQDGRE